MRSHSETKKQIDPVCGMEVDPLTALSTCYNGTEIYFCAQGCLEAFNSKPGKYTQKQRKGFWRRYLERLNKATGGRPPSCCH